MCTQWCCKNCTDDCTKLTHRWAQERCNDYYVARSRDQNVTECPKGPWQLQRAYHRHPYRGAQRCDDCKRDGRKKFKRVQSARQKANVALGEKPEYLGALYVGELELPEHLFEPGKVDAMKSNWESFNLANGHLPSHELEREWTKRFTSLKEISVDGGGWGQLSEGNAFTFGERMVNGEGLTQGNKTFAKDVPQSLHQETQQHSKPITYKRNEPSRSAHEHLPNHSHQIIERPKIATVLQHASRSASQQAQYNICSNIDGKNRTIIEQAASQNTHCDQIQDNISSGTKRSSYPTVRDEKAALSQYPHCKANTIANPTTRSSSSLSQLTRARPWDL